jgi:hypothetical protein
VLFVLSVRWQPYNSRLHVPLIGLGAPLIALLLERAGRRATGMALGIATFMVVPALLGNATRPLLPILASPNDPEVASVLTAGRREAYFNAAPVLEPIFQRLVQEITARGCHRVALVTGYDSSPDGSTERRPQCAASSPWINRRAGKAPRVIGSVGVRAGFRLGFRISGIAGAFLRGNPFDPAQRLRELGTASIHRVRRDRFRLRKALECHQALEQAASGDRLPRLGRDTALEHRNR